MRKAARRRRSTDKKYGTRGLLDRMKRTIEKAKAQVRAKVGPRLRVIKRRTTEKGADLLIG